jgi:hypothetical protein
MVAGSSPVTKNVTTPSEAVDQADEQLLLVIERWAELPPARRKMIVKLVQPSV